MRLEAAPHILYGGYFADFYLLIMWTPRRPVKRKLVFTPASVKRFRPSTAKTFQRVNRRTQVASLKGATLSATVAKLAKAVGNLQPEVKYADASLGIPAGQWKIADSGGNIFHVTAISQGDTDSTRTGNAITVKNLSMRFRFDLNSVAVPANFGVRIAVVIDKQQVADTTPVIADIFSGANPVTGFPTVANLERFKVVYLTKHLALNMLLNPAVDTVNFYEYNWSGTMKVEYNAAAFNDIQKNGIYVVLFGNLPAGGTFAGDGSCRIGFSDV